MYSLISTDKTKGDSGPCSQALRATADGKGVEVVSDRPTIGCNMLVGSSTARSYQWQDYILTTPVVEILSDEPDRVLFRTRNSTYEWRNT